MNIHIWISCRTENHPDHFIWLSNLGSALSAWYKRRGSINNLDRGITASEQALKSTPIHHTNRAISLNNLGSGLLGRYKLKGSLEDLNEAISILQLAVEARETDHPDSARALNNLGLALLNQYLRMGSMDVLNRAITTCENAIESTPSDHPDRANMFNSLSSALQARYRRKGSMSDILPRSTSSPRSMTWPSNHALLPGLGLPVLCLGAQAWMTWKTHNLNIPRCGKLSGAQSVRQPKLKLGATNIF